MKNCRKSGDNTYKITHISVDNCPRVINFVLIIIIIMSLFNEDNIFSTSTNLTYGPRWKTYLTEQYHTIYTLYT